MSTISGTAGASSAWSALSSTRSARPPGGMERGEMKDRMFAKVDADGSGGVDATELQGLLDKVAKKTGVTQDASTADLLKKMDSNGDGSLDKDELDAGMKSLMPEPSSTAAFAASRGAEGRGGARGPGGPGGPPPGPPPEAASSTGSTGSTSSTSSTSTDPLDTNQDGVVSPEEQAAGEVKNILQALVKAVDSNGDGNIDSSELDTFKSTLASVLKEAGSSSASDNTSKASNSDSQLQQGGFDLRSLAARVLQQYAQASNDASGVGSTLSVAA